MRHKFLGFVALGVLAACSTGAGMPQPELTFQHLQPLALNVRNLQTDVRPGAEVDGFVVSPTKSSREYLSSRFRADGTQGSFRATMDEATVRHVYSPSRGKVSGFFNVAGHDVYDVKLVLRLEHVSDSGTVLYANTIKAQRTMNITEHASVAEREQHELEGMEALFKDLDNQVMQVTLNQMKLSAP